MKNEILLYETDELTERIEESVDTLAKKVAGIDLQINESLPPKQGIFYNEQIFDA